MDQKREILRLLSEAAESIKEVKLQVLNATVQIDFAIATIQIIDAVKQLRVAGIATTTIVKELGQTPAKS